MPGHADDKDQVPTWLRGSRARVRGPAAADQDTYRIEVLTQISAADAIARLVRA